MPIIFRVHASDQYFISEWTEKISVEEIKTGYTEFFQSELWSPQHHELADLSRCDLSSIKAEEIQMLALWFQNLYETLGVDSTRTAFYAPTENRIPAVIYGVWMDDSIEETKLFSTLEDAIAWLIGR